MVYKWLHATVALGLALQPHLLWLPLATSVLTFHLPIITSVPMTYHAFSPRRP